MQQRSSELDSVRQRMFIQDQKSEYGDETVENPDPGSCNFQKVFKSKIRVGILLLLINFFNWIGKSIRFEASRR
jgi:hypothetical protein